MKRPYLIAAYDGADDDGGTLYVLLDDDGEKWTPLLTASWPMPLEHYAATVGRAVRRVAAQTDAIFDYLDAT